MFAIRNIFHNNFVIFVILRKQWNRCICVKREVFKGISYFTWNNKFQNSWTFRTTDKHVCYIWHNRLHFQSHRYCIVRIHTPTCSQPFYYSLALCLWTPFRGENHQIQSHSISSNFNKAGGDYKQRIYRVNETNLHSIFIVYKRYIQTYGTRIEKSYRIG